MTSKNKNRNGYDLSSEQSDDDSERHDGSPEHEKFEDSDYGEEINVSRVPKEDLLAMILSWCSSEEQLATVLETMAYIEECQLIKYVRRARNDEDGCWSLISSVKNRYDYKSIQHALRNTTGVIARNAFDAARKYTWDMGATNIYLGTDSLKFVDNAAEYSLLPDMIGDVDSFIQDVEASKKKSLVNAINAVVECLPQTKLRTLKTKDDKYQAIIKIINKFDEGKGDESLDITKFKLPTEAGATLPHTLDSKEWLAVSATILIKQLFEDAAVSFQATDVMDVRQAVDDIGSYLVYDEDEESPYWKGISPALFCRDYNGDVWAWREVNSIVSAQVAVEVKQNPGQADQVDKMRKKFTREHAEKYAKGKSKLIGAGDHIAVDSVSDAELLFGAKHIYNFYKRGYSKKAEVEENDQFLHIVRYNTSLEIGDKEYYSILLPDLNSVVLLPLDLWATSTHVANNGSKIFNSRSGVTRPKADFTKYNLYFTLYRLSHTFKMIEQWKAKSSYDYKKHAALLKNKSKGSKDKGFLKLFQNSSLKTRETVSSLVENVSCGIIRGLWISPVVSKHGKAAVGAIQRETEFSSAISDILEVQIVDDVVPKRKKKPVPPKKQVKVEAVLDDEEEIQD